MQDYLKDILVWDRSGSTSTVITESPPICGGNAGGNQSGEAKDNHGTCCTLMT